MSLFEGLLVFFIVWLGVYALVDRICRAFEQRAYGKAFTSFMDAQSKAIDSKRVSDNNEELHEN